MPFFPEQQAAHVALAFFVGLFGGWVFYRLWRAFIAPGDSKRFWQTFPTQLRAMLDSEESADMLRHYRAVLSSLAKYSLRHLLAVLLAAAPLTLTWLLVDGYVLGVDAEVRSRNPFHPLLGDLEFCLCLAATVGSVAAALRYRRQADRAS